MNPKPHSQIRTRRHSSCYLHPADPAAAGLCASCLRERLSGLDSLADLETPPISLSFLAGGDGAGPGVGGGRGSTTTTTNTKGGFRTSPDFRRCRSVSTAKCDASAPAISEPRRKSCDVRPLNGNSLACLFDVDDECGGSVAESKVETKNILSGAAAIDTGEGGDNTRVEGSNVIDEFGDEGEGKTMKEYIDLELQSKNRKLKDFKDLAGNVREAASVLSKKLRKWRQKQKDKKLSYGSDRGGSIGGKSETNSLRGLTFEEIQSEVQDYSSMARRSCDIEPRFSVDCGRVSFEEPRASWDGFLIARTIPRLTPMLSTVENVMLVGGNKLDSHRVSVDGQQMNSIMEDETSSGGSGQSNSDSSCSQRRSSFDRSSSVRSFGKKIESDDLKCITSNAKVSPQKLVITERELKDWRLNSIKVGDEEEEEDDHHHHHQVGKKSCVPKDTIVSVESKGGSKKSVNWRRKMLNVFGFKQKASEKGFETSSSDAMDSVATDTSEKHRREFSDEVKDATAGNSWRLERCGSIVGPRRSVDVIGSNNNTRRSFLNNGYVNKGREQHFDVLDQTRSDRYNTSSNFDDAAATTTTTMPFYLTPLRSSRRRRNSICISGNVLQLN